MLQTTGLVVMSLCFGIITCDMRSFSFKSCPEAKTSKNVLGSVTAVSRTDCALKCVENLQCAAVSYCPSGSGTNCQMTTFYTQGSCAGLDADVNCEQIEVANRCQNAGTFAPRNDSCECPFGFVGQYCHRRFRDCEETPKAGASQPVLIQPLGTDFVFEWYCEPDGITTIVLASSNPPANSYDRPWADFKNGVPVVRFSNEFYFIGLDAMHYLTKQAVFDLRVYLLKVNPLIVGTVWYRNVSIDSEANGYALRWERFEQDTMRESQNFLDGLGALGDPTKSLQGARFGTYDNDVNNCATNNNNFGFWYNAVGCGLIFPTLGSCLVEWPYDNGGVTEMTTFVTGNWGLVHVSNYVDD